MKIILDGSRIQIRIENEGISMSETIVPIDALRYSKTLKLLADQLIEEFPNKPKEKKDD